MALEISFNKLLLTIVLIYFIKFLHFYFGFIRNWLPQLVLGADLYFDLSLIFILLP